MAIIFTLITFFSTLAGGLTSIKYKHKLHLILGFTAGVILGLVAFDILPEIFGLVKNTGMNPQLPMIALVVGFLIFHILEKTLLIHHGQEENYGKHHHPSVGKLSSLALIGHSFFDGIGIGLGFQVSTSIGILVAIAVIGHDFCDGLNTGSIMILNKNNMKSTIKFILADALAPILGAFSTLFFKLPETYLIIYLGFFAGFLLYIGLEDILPEAHSKKFSFRTVLMTTLGTVFIFFVTQMT